MELWREWIFAPDPASDPVRIRQAGKRMPDVLFEPNGTIERQDNGNGADCGIISAL